MDLLTSMQNHNSTLGSVAEPPRFVALVCQSVYQSPAQRLLLSTQSEGLAIPTGLEPVISGVTGRRVYHLHQGTIYIKEEPTLYISIKLPIHWLEPWGTGRDLNQHLCFSTFMYILYQKT